MKKNIIKAAALALALVAAPALSGCQPTPEKQAVADKRNDDLEQKLTQKASGKYAADARWDEDVDLSNTAIPTPGPEMMGMPDATASEAPAASAAEAETPPAETTPPDTADKNKKIKLKFAADVIIPDADKIPVVSIDDSGFTQEEADAIIAYFSEGREMIAPREEQTKAEIEEQILMQKRILSALRDGSAKKSGGSMGMTDEDGVEHTYDTYEVEIDGTVYHENPEQVEDWIKSLEEMYKEAPDTVEEKPATSQFRTYAEAYGLEDDGDQSQFISVAIKLDGEKQATLSINNNSHGQYKDSYMSYSIQTREQYWGTNDTWLPMGADKEGQPNGVALPKEEAEALAKGFAEKVGAEGMELVSVHKGFDFDWDNNKRECWVARFRRKVAGVPVTLEGRTGTQVKLDESNAAEHGYTPEEVAGQGEMYTSGWSYENLFMAMDDSGIINVEWQGRFRENEVVNDNVALLPFDEVKDIIREQMPLHMVDWGISSSTTITSLEYQVYRVELGLMRTAVKDKPNEFRLIPVWDVFAAEKYIYDEAALRKEMEDQMDEIKRHNPEFDLEKYIEQAVSGSGLGGEGDGPQNSFLTINAITGTPIDREVGY